MQTTHFQKVFNIGSLLFLTAILGAFCTICFGFSMNYLQEIDFLVFFYRFISTMFAISLFTSLMSSVILFFLISREIKDRQKEDNLYNLWQSIKQTLSIRTFLHQSELSEAVTTTEQAKVTHYNPIHKRFNKAVDKSIIDVRKDTIILMIRIPKTQQAKKILDDMNTMIIEEVARYNPDYFFSPSNPDKKWAYFVGTKRQ